MRKQETEQEINTQHITPLFLDKHPRKNRTQENRSSS